MAAGETELMFPFLQELCLGGFMIEGGNHHQQHHNPHSPDLDSLLHYRTENNISFDDDQYCNSYYYYGTEPHLPVITSPEGNLVGQSHSISDYDLGAEGDLFKAPEPVLEERILPMLNPLTTALSMISCGEDQNQSRNDDHTLTHTPSGGRNHIETTDHLLFSDVYYDCKKDLLESTVIEDTFPELADIKFPALDMGEDHHRPVDILDTVEVPLQKSVSHQCLATTNGGGGTKSPNFVDFQEMDVGAAFRLRRAYSEGDIKTLGNGKTTVEMTFNANILRPQFDRMLTVDDYKMEERRQKLSRYREKKMQRNFGRKIKYACRKALADNQPRVRGRFARTEECKVFK